MTRLFLVRHGPTHIKAMVGWSDVPADLGDSAALARLSAHLPDTAQVVSSDLLRAVSTADAIQGSRHRLPHLAGLREFHFGGWELRSASEIEAADPALARAYWDHPGDIRPPGGESWNDGRKRMDAAIDALLRDHAGGDLIVVAHFGLILSQLQRALAVPAAQVLAQRIDTLSVTALERNGTGWQVGAINHRP